MYFWKRVLTSDELTAVYKVLKAKYRIENTQLGDWNLGPAGMQIPLPSGVQLQLDVPLTDASTNPPVNLSTPGSRTATKVGSPTLQSSVIRPGKTYVGYAPGTPGAATTGEWSWTRAAWNTLTAKNFAIEAWINIPTLASADGSVQHLCGAGAPNTMGTSFGLYKTAGQWYMLCNSYYGQLAVGGITITNGTWHHIAMTYTHSGTTTNLYFDGILVGSGTALAATDYGSPTTFYLGGHDNNGIYTNALAGYISNFRLYT